MATVKNEKVFVMVDGEKVELTNRLMMEFAVQALTECGYDEAVIAKAEKHLASLAKSTKAGQPSPTAIKNAETAQEVVAWMKSKNLASVTLKQIAEEFELYNTRGGANTSKARAIIKPLIDANAMQKIEKSDPAEYVLC